MSGVRGEEETDLYRYVAFLVWLPLCTLQLVLHLFSTAGSDEGSAKSEGGRDWILKFEKIRNLKFRIFSSALTRATRLISQSAILHLARSTHPARQRETTH